MRTITSAVMNVSPATIGPAHIDAIFKWVETVSHRRIPYASQHDRDRYIRSFNIRPKTDHDPDGFLATLGLHDLMAIGRTIDGGAILLGLTPADDKWYSPFQRGLQNFWKKNPKIFHWLSKKIDKLLLAEIDPPLAVEQNGPDGIKEPLFAEDFHDGTNGSYGTYSAALAAGFSKEAAARIAKADLDIDRNESRYGQTDSIPFGHPSRHFNTNTGRKGKEDSRLIWAQRHLKKAISLARTGRHEEAELELGYGLHSLQDALAHGQFSPLAHIALGKSVDDITFNPIAAYEAQQATGAYLKRFVSLAA